jgi:indolepyruvate ferredoxin oxidoreductase
VAGDIASQRLGLGEASLVLAFDMVAALGDEAARTLSTERTRFLGNDRIQETAAFVANPDARVDTGLLRRKVGQRVGPERVVYVDATGLAQAMFGDAIAANMFMLGVAAQHGWLPVSLAAIERAIDLNGVQVEANTRAFHTGRLWVADARKLLEAVQGRLPARPEAVVRTLREIVAHRSALLAAFQDADYARRYAALVERTSRAEGRSAAGSDALARAVAHNFAKLMAYKDEYEVARLYADPSFRKALDTEFEGDLKLRFNLAPPLFSRRDAQTGELLKRSYGPWILPAMHVLARFRFLRGTAFDPFGRTAERRAERGLIEEYERTIDQLLSSLTPGNLKFAAEIAALPEQIRGYGHVKERSIEKARSSLERLMSQFREAARVQALAA